jgi:hypothetical protein
MIVRPTVSRCAIASIAGGHVVERHDAADHGLHLLRDHEIGRSRA